MYYRKGRVIMTVSLRLDNSDAELFRQTVLEHIEDELDLKAYEEAMAEYKADPTTYSLEEVIRELDLK